ncbi:MAG: hypothetical protein ACTSU5_01295 [Promethearchaeota archaeon]
MRRRLVSTLVLTSLIVLAPLLYSPGRVHAPAKDASERGGIAPKAATLNLEVEGQHSTPADGAVLPPGGVGVRTYVRQASQPYSPLTGAGDFGLAGDLSGTCPSGNYTSWDTYDNYDPVTMHPDGWSISSPRGDATVAPETGSHHDVLQLTGDDVGAYETLLSSAWRSFGTSSTNVTTVEFWTNWVADSRADGFYVKLLGSGGRAAWLFAYDYGNGPYWFCKDPAGPLTAVAQAPFGTWLHHRIVHSPSASSYDWYINGELVGTNLPGDPGVAVESCEFYLWNYQPQTTTVWVDALDHSQAAPDYWVGRSSWTLLSSFTSLVEGSYSYRWDSDSFTYQTPYLAFEVDGTPPVVSISVPLTGTHYSAWDPVPEFIVVAADANLDSPVTVSIVNGSFPCDPAGGNNYELSPGTSGWDSWRAYWNSIPQGTMDVFAFAYDLAGNEGTDQVVIAKDYGQLEIQVASPDNGSVFGPTAPGLAVDVYSASGEPSLNYTLDSGPPRDAGNGTETTADHYRFEFTLNQGDWDAHLDEGTPVDVLLNATFGTTYKVVELSLWRDTTDPVVKILEPQANQLFGNETIFVSVQTDEPHVEHVTYSIVPAGGGTGVGPVYVDALAFTIEQEKWDQVTGGLYLMVRVYDEVGNSGSDTVYIVKDVTPPDLALLVPDNGTTCYETQPAYQLQASDSHALTFSASADGGGTWYPLSGADGELPLDLWSNLPYGNVTVQFRAVDAAGNANTTSVRLVKADSSPGVEVLSPAAGAVFGPEPPEYRLEIEWAGGEAGSVTVAAAGVPGVYQLAGASGMLPAALWGALTNGSAELEFTATSPHGRFASAAVTVQVDVAPPEVVVVSPVVYQEVGAGAPSYRLQVRDAHLDSAWYTLSDSLTGEVVEGVGLMGAGSWSGTVDQDMWDRALFRNVTISFHLLDSLGNEAVVNVSVTRTDYLGGRSEHLDLSLLVDMPLSVAAILLATLGTSAVVAYGVTRRKIGYPSTTRSRKRDYAVSVSSFGSAVLALVTLDSSGLLASPDSTRWQGYLPGQLLFLVVLAAGVGVVLGQTVGNGHSLGDAAREASKMVFDSTGMTKKEQERALGEALRHGLGKHAALAKRVNVATLAPDRKKPLPTTSELVSRLREKFTAARNVLTAAVGGSLGKLGPAPLNAVRPLPAREASLRRAGRVKGDTRNGGLVLSLVLLAAAVLLYAFMV